MKVFWVLGYEWWDAAGDNFEASFETHEEAQAYVDNERANAVYPHNNYEIINIADRL
jgi:hypothetical protein